MSSFFLPRVVRFAAPLMLSASIAGAQTIPTPAALTSYVDSVATAAIAQHQAVGVSVAVVRKGQIVLAKGYGLADLENEVPATENTVYRIGSVTKQFTAAAIMRLVEQGKLSLDDTLQKFFPSYPVQGHRVLVRHLLNHTSGIKSYTSLGPKWFSKMRLDMAHDTLLAMFANEPFDFSPGDKWSYDNSGYFLLGMIIEKVSGKTYGKYLEDEFFTPLGLKGTFYCDLRPIIKHRAQGYTPLPGGTFQNSDLLSMTQPYAAGSLCSTVLDLATWAQALASGKVVTPASYAKMSTPLTLNDGKPLVYGFGLGVGNLQGHRQVSHNGGINGFISELHHYVDDSLFTVVLTNIEGPTAPNLERAIAKRALGIPDNVIKDLPIPTAELARVAGTYAMGPLMIRIFADGATLKSQAQGPGQGAFRLKYQGGNFYVADFDPEVTAEFAAGNPAPSFTLDQRGNKGQAIRKP
ncbi:MAG: beta-lactamase family protein [Gemmatimonadota bacterium]|nr:beta-lactamase family protein [Gemmatimonadota bacterium]